MIGIAAQLGSETAIHLLETQRQDAQDHPDEAVNSLDAIDDILFQTRWRALQTAVRAKENDGIEAMNEVFEKGVLQLIKDFPKRKDLFDLLIAVANGSSSEHARELLKQVIDSKAPERTKDAARDQLTRLESIGKPVDLKYTDFNGHPVDLADLKGKVVLIDFWATWCGPCLAEMPHVRAAYEKYHEQGFEVLGISLDSDKETLANFLAQEKIPWPQYFDGEGWAGSFPQRFGIHAIPTMLLVDKKGLLRDLSARGNLEEKVKKMLAEQIEKAK
jgi:thiol-disulfide isomerase/thioredoxin